jgi:ATP-dependent Lhr-like helicase
MSKRKFRDIAVISGLVFQGYPDRKKKDRSLQSSSQLLYSVFQDYEPDNLLYQQTFEEVMTFQLEEGRLRDSLQRISQQQIILITPERPTPFSFPLIVEVLNRERLTSENLEDRIKKMMLKL